MQSSIVQMIESQKKEIVDRWQKEMESVSKEFGVDTLNMREHRDWNDDFIAVIFESIDADDGNLKGRFRQFVENLIQHGWSLGYFTKGLQIFRRILLDIMTTGETNLSKNMYDTFSEIENWTDCLTNQIVDEYSGNWENTFQLQQTALKELSAPVLPIFEHICVVPLIGTIDTERAQLIVDNLLEKVIEYRSHVVLIDITGVPVVDTMVAHHIIQSAEAVRLAGAECILVGIRPEIAQTTVNLGIDLNKIHTKSSLQKGIQTALKLTHKEIIDIKK